MLNKNISAYCVKPLVSAGIRVVIPGYDLAPTGMLIFLFTSQKY